MSFPSESWWTPPQVALVEDRARNWRQANFEPSDAVSFSNAGRTIIGRRRSGAADVPVGRVIPGGWDHEHCALCWATISLLPGDQSSAYTDGHDWLCSACYTGYIVPRL